MAGAAASFRGYRHQCLYTLHRALTSSTDEIVQPEGIEDLAVFDGERLTEVFQVKSVGEPLAVHHLKSARGSFFTRAAAILRDDPNSALRIVSFGPVGPELAAAIASDGPERSRVISKSADSSVSPEELRAVFERLHPIDEVTETALEGAIESRLAQLVTGIDAKASLDLLMFWVYRFAEARSALTRGRVEHQLIDVGRYLSERAAHHLEWFTTIEPLEDLTIDAARRDALASEIHHGMQARWEHVQAGVTVERPAQLDQGDRIVPGFRHAATAAAAKQLEAKVIQEQLREQLDDLGARTRRTWPDAVLADEEAIEAAIQAVAGAARGVMARRGSIVVDPESWEADLADAIADSCLEAVAAEEARIPRPPGEGIAGGVAPDAVKRSTYLRLPPTDAPVVSTPPSLGWRVIARIEHHEHPGEYPKRSSGSSSLCVALALAQPDRPVLEQIPLGRSSPGSWWQANWWFDPDQDQPLVGLSERTDSSLPQPSPLLAPMPLLVHALTLLPSDARMAMADDRGDALLLRQWRTLYESGEYELPRPSVRGAELVLRPDLFDRLLHVFGERVGWFQASMWFNATPDE